MFVQAVERNKKLGFEDADYARVLRLNYSSQGYNSVFQQYFRVLDCRDSPAVGTAQA